MVWSFSRVGGEGPLLTFTHPFPRRASAVATSMDMFTQMLTSSRPCVSVATNTARDVGARLMAITIWGLEAGGGAYAAITALTNIAATLLAAVFYELVFADYHRGEYQPPSGLFRNTERGARGTDPLDARVRVHVCVRVCVWGGGRKGVRLTRLG